ncbi:MAG: efflux RND transporter periplasmic adaptor subunit [Dysgonamonadaceae bacterium]|nr:efflux RND transporter periplasmic adaptor subunit [Dysgonamonadaceae bacterium]
MKSIKLSHLVLLLGATVLFSCGAKTEDTTEVVKPKVKVETAIKTDVIQSSEYTATIQSDVVNKISPAMPARIRKIYVEVGDRVRKGQTLVTLDRTNLSQSQTQIANLERDLQRYRELYEVGGISKQQIEQLEVQLEVAKSTSSNLAENTTLTSPINGIVTQRNYDSGDMPAGMHILQIEDFNPVKLLINVSENLYTELNKGMEVQVGLDVYPDEEFTGKVWLIHPTINQASHTFPVEIKIPNSDSRIRPGMFARVNINLGSNEGIMVPDASVMKQTGSNDRHVFVIKDGKANKKVITIGQHLGNYYEVISGVEVGDEIVVAGASRLSDNQEVEIVQ